MVQGKSLLDCNALNLLCFIFLSTFVVWYLRYHWRRRHLYLSSWKRSGPFPLPFVGNALSFVGSTDDILEKIMMVTTKYKSPVPIWFGPKLIFAISEPKDMETVMNSPYALEKQDVYKFVKMFVGEGLFTASAPTWKRHRKIIMPTLNQNILNSFVSIFAKHSDILLEQLETKAGKGEFDIFSYISNCSLKNLCETAMGISVNEETVDSDFIHWTKKAMEICFKRMVNIWYHSDFIFSISSHSLRCNELLSKLHNFVGDVVRLKREEYQTKYDEISKRKSFLEHLIKLSEQSTKFNDQELRDEVVTFMIAGTETNATLISYVFIVLGMYPEIQEKVYQEIVAVLGLNRSVEHTDLPKLVYMERVIYETLRIFPPAPIVARNVSENIKLDECILPAGCSVALNIIGLHWNSSVYPEPFKFDPDRFLREEVAKRHPFSWLPFSGGLRNCVGYKYAIMTLKTVIASTVRKYKFSSKYKQIKDIDVKLEFMLRPADGFNVSIELRH